MNDKNPKSLILEALLNHPEGLTMVSLADVVGLHRHTTTKYLYELIGAGLVYQRKVGPARLCYLKERVEQNEEEIQPIGTQHKQWFGGKSQIRFIAIFLLLGIILISSTVIASNFLNETFGNTSPTGQFISDSTADVIPGHPNPKIENVENIQHASTEDNNINIILIDNETSKTLDTSQPVDINDNEPTEITKPSDSSENQPINNESSEMNDTDVSKIDNETNPIEIPPITVEKPILNVEVEYPKKIIRGEKITLKATIENTGSVVAKNIKYNWIIPSGLEIISEEEDCQDLEPNVFCTTELTLQTSLSVELGIKEIKIVVNYGT
jgi:uncharacterized repeat protein (TIGR01451 family)